MVGMRFNKKLEQLIKLNGLSQKELSQKSGVDKTIICRFLKSGHNISLDNTQKILKILDIDLDFIVQSKIKSFIDDNKPIVRTKTKIDVFFNNLNLHQKRTVFKSILSFTKNKNQVIQSNEYNNLKNELGF